MRGDWPHEEAYLLARKQFLGHANGVAGIAIVFARQHLELLPEHTAGRVNLLDGELHAALVRFQERREDLVAIDLADLDRLRVRCYGDQRRAGEEGENGDSECSTAFHRFSL